MRLRPDLIYSVRGEEDLNNITWAADFNLIEAVWITRPPRPRARFRRHWPWPLTSRHAAVQTLAVWMKIGQPYFLGPSSKSHLNSFCATSDHKAISCKNSSPLSSEIDSLHFRLAVPPCMIRVRFLSRAIYLPQLKSMDKSARQEHFYKNHHETCHGAVIQSRFPQDQQGYSFGIPAFRVRTTSI